MIVKQHFTAREFIPNDVTPGYREYAEDALKRAVVNAIYDKFEFGKKYIVETARQVRVIHAEDAPYGYGDGLEISIVGYIAEVEE